jgi:TOBE domain
VVVLAVRPEWVAIEPAGEPSGGNEIRARVSEVVAVGPDVRITATQARWSAWSAGRQDVIKLR